MTKPRSVHIIANLKKRDAFTWPAAPSPASRTGGGGPVDLDLAGVSAAETLAPRPPQADFILCLGGTVRCSPRTGAGRRGDPDPRGESRGLGFLTAISPRNSTPAWTPSSTAPTGSRPAPHPGPASEDGGSDLDLHASTTSWWTKNFSRRAAVFRMSIAGSYLGTLRGRAHRGTATGSTAYALSAGGPSSTRDFPVPGHPICAHSLAIRPLVFSEDEVSKSRISSTTSPSRSRRRTGCPPRDPRPVHPHRQVRTQGLLAFVGTARSTRSCAPSSTGRDPKDR